MDYCDYFVTYRQVVLGQLEMHISQKPKDVLHITDVQIKIKKIFLSHNLGKTNLKIALKVSKTASINDVGLSKNLQN